MLLVFLLICGEIRFEDDDMSDLLLGSIKEEDFNPRVNDEKDEKMFCIIEMDPSPCVPFSFEPSAVLDPLPISES